MSTIRILVSLLLVFLFHSQTVLAHGDDHGPITEEQVLTITTAAVAQLVESDVGLGFGQLKTSWNALPKSATRIRSKVADYYIVGVEHEKEGRTLFVLISADGGIYDANFTGKFKELE
jgi:hypothetical protein